MKNFVILDLDGTIVDTLEGLTKAANLVMEEFNYPYRYDREEVKEFIGNGARKLFLSLTHRLTFDEKLENEYKVFLQYYEQNQYTSKPYPTVVSSLKKLNKNKIKIIIYSNKPNKILHKLVNEVFKGVDFSFIQGQDDRYLPKPDVILLKEICYNLRLNPLNGLYVGDSFTDYLTACNMQMDMAFCTYGYVHKGEKEKIHAHFIDRFDEIFALLK